MKLFKKKLKCTACSKKMSESHYKTMKKNRSYIEENLVLSLVEKQIVCYLCLRYLK